MKKLLWLGKLTERVRMNSKLLWLGMPVMRIRNV